MCQLKYISGHRFIVPLFAVLLLLASLSAWAAVVSDETIKGLYESNRDLIAKKGFLELGDLVFLHGKTRYSEDFGTEELGFERALLEAKSELNKIIFSDTKWPTGVSENLRESLKTSYLRLKEVELHAGGFDVVDSGKYAANGKTVYFTVIAVPKKAVRFQYVSYKDLIKCLDDAFVAKDERLLSSPYLEICTRDRITSVIDLMAQQAKEQYGDALTAIILGRRVAAPGTFHLKGVTFSEDELQSFSRDQLFKILTRLPYDPEVCYRIGESFRKEGFRRNADLFFSRGTFWQSKDKYNALCYRAVSNEPFRSWRIPADNAVSVLEKKIRDRVAKVSISFNPLSLIVIENMGNVPIENAQRTSAEFQQGNEAFFSDPPNLNKALELYLKALEKAFTADGCNMIGRCLQLRGEMLLAIPFYRQAVSLDPEHPYAGANLASCLWEVGEKEQAKNTAQSALKNPHLSDLGRKQISALEL